MSVTHLYGDVLRLIADVMLRSSTEAKASIEQLTDEHFRSSWSNPDVLGAIDLMSRHAAELDDSMSTALFIGTGKMEAPPWGSVYLTEKNVVMGPSTARYIEFLNADLSITPQDSERIPADHIGAMLSVVAHCLHTQAFEALKVLLGEHLMPWAPRYFELLKHNTLSQFYCGLAILSKAILADLVDCLDIEVTNKEIVF